MQLPSSPPTTSRVRVSLLALSSEHPRPIFIPSSDGVRIAVYDWGDPGDSGAPVLLLSHATGFHGRAWGPLVSHLAHRYRCVALDYRGHGLSEVPAGISMAWTGMGDDAAAVLDFIGTGHAIYGIGHSMGGASLVLAAAAHPGAFRSLWLYEPVLVPPGSLSFDGPNPMAEGAARRRDRFESYDQAIANFSAKAPLDRLHPDALRAYVEGGFSRQGDGAIVLNCRPDTEAAVFAQAARSGAWAVLPALQLPVAIVAGHIEEFGPVTFAASAAAALPQGTLVERPRLGHFGPLEDPASMAADVMTWVKANP